jgi:hypothetical protein
MTGLRWCWRVGFRATRPCSDCRAGRASRLGRRPTLRVVAADGRLGFVGEGMLVPVGLRGGGRWRGGQDGVPRRVFYVVGWPASDEGCAQCAHEGAIAVQVGREGGQDLARSGVSCHGLRRPSTCRGHVRRPGRCRYLCTARAILRATSGESGLTAITAITATTRRYLRMIGSWHEFWPRAARGPRWVPVSPWST